MYRATVSVAVGLIGDGTEGQFTSCRNEIGEFNNTNTATLSPGKQLLDASFREIEPGDKATFPLARMFGGTKYMNIGIRVDYSALPFGLWKRTTVRHFISSKEADGATHWVYCPDGNMLSLTE